MKRKLAALFAVALFSPVGNAVLPDSGWYWNPSESGRGYEIEIQNNVLFMSVFMYGNDGHPIWIVTGGPMTTDRSYSGDAIQTDAGWCLGCAYKTPTVVPYGPVTVNFTGPTTATVTIKGTTINIERQQFGFDFSSPTTPLLGEWGMVNGSKLFPVYFGQRITFPSAQTLSSGPAAVGNVTGEVGATNLAVGYRDAGTGKWAILLDSAPSYYQLYVMDFAAFDRLEGDEYVYVKGTSPTSSLPSVGVRIRSAAAAGGANAPGTDKAQRALARSDADLAGEIAAAKALGRPTASPEIAALAAKLEAALNK